MPLLPKDEAGILKAQVYDMTEGGAKQALYAMVQILESHHCIESVAFRLLVQDAKKYSEKLLNGTF